MKDKMTKNRLKIYKERKQNPLINNHKDGIPVRRTNHRTFYGPYW